MNVLSIETPQFKINLQIKIFDSDVNYPSNTIITVSVVSDDFSAVTDMDIDIKQLIAFTDNFSMLYTTLEGNAKIQEPFGVRQYIEFCGDGRGHIYISGKLNSSGRNGFTQELKFENCIDQTCISDFLAKISALCQKHLMIANL